MLLCPQSYIQVRPFAYESCVIANLYKVTPKYIPFISSVLGKVYISEFNLHLWALTLFASLIAPFGGFFASGIKRGLEIKDFADLIPGHGGILDRLDCLILMTIFVYVYMKELIQYDGFSIDRLWYQIDRLPVTTQQEIFIRLSKTVGSVGSLGF